MFFVFSVQGKSSSGSRGVSDAGATKKKLVQGCPPLEGAIEGQVREGGVTLSSVTFGA